jgi:hypothetical protein
MTQSKKDDSFTITLSETIDLDSIIDTTGDITINLNDTYGTTTTYMANSVYSVSGATDNITISDGTFTIDSNSIDWTVNSILNETRIDPDEIERMCEHYPALTKVWRNFKNVYDMVKQDYEGKKKAGELDDDIPF